jgi:hypothetical protein
MESPDLRTTLLRLLSGAPELTLASIALVADVVAADARFNLACAEQKRVGGDVDWIVVLEAYDAIATESAAAGERFQRGGDQAAFQQVMQRALDELRRHAAALGV